MTLPENEKKYVVVVCAPKPNLPPILSKILRSRIRKKMKTTTDPTQVSHRWNYLPEDLVGEIMVRLSSADRIRFSACCNKFWSLMPQYKLLIDQQLPWLVKRGYKYHSLPFGYEFRLFDPIHETPYSCTSIHEITCQFGVSKDGIKLLASQHGWLITSWEKQVIQHQPPTTILVSLVLVSPFTKKIIVLPDLDHSSFMSDQCQYSRSVVAAFSADPSSPDCVYFVLRQSNDRQNVRISTYRNGDSEWKTVKFDAMGFLSINRSIYHEGSFYCWAFKGRDLAVYDVVVNRWRLVTGANPTKERRNSICGRCYRYPYLLVCDGKLLFIYLYVPCNDQNVPDDKREDRFLVYEYDQSQWVEKTHLGDQALFLCRRGSFSISTSSDIANRIYYYRPRGRGRKQYYSLEDGKSYKCCGSSYWSGIEVSGIWIKPPHLQATQRYSEKKAA